MDKRADFLYQYIHNPALPDMPRSLHEERINGVCLP